MRLSQPGLIFGFCLFNLVLHVIGDDSRYSRSITRPNRVVTKNIREQTRHEQRHNQHRRRSRRNRLRVRIKITSTNGETKTRLTHGRRQKIPTSTLSPSISTTVYHERKPNNITTEMSSLEIVETERATSEFIEPEMKTTVTEATTVTLRETSAPPEAHVIREVAVQSAARFQKNVATEQNETRYATTTISRTTSSSVAIQPIFLLVSTLLTFLHAFAT